MTITPPSGPQKPDSVFKRTFWAVYGYVKPYEYQIALTLSDKATVIGILTAIGTMIGRHFDPHLTAEVTQGINMLMWMALFFMTKPRQPPGASKP